MHIVSAAPMDGPLPDDVITRIKADLATPHQLKIVDRFHVVYAGKGYALLLDRAALESVAQQLEPGSYFANLLVQIIESLTLKPKLEPEVREVIARKTAPPQPKPKPDPKPWRARIRIKDAYGQVEEINEPVGDMAELADIINRCDDFSFVRNIKIKLEPVL